MAVVAMVEPEIAENTVPATTATTASRPGTCRISRSTPSITLTARPVWNSTSPIRMNSGIGVSEKLATDPTLFLASCVRPASPPRNRIAPAILIARKVNATGSPRKSSTVDPPSISHAAACQDMPRLRPQPAVTASSRGARSPRYSRRIRNVISTASMTNATGSGARIHHSGMTRVLIESDPPLKLASTAREP